MASLPFALRRPWLLLRDLLVDRERPDLAALGRLLDPERFVWAILPHAARTFSACITLLPAPSARAAAVAYLYCRILDTYEDLMPDLAARTEALSAFAARFAPGAAPSAAPELPDAGPRDARDRAHGLLVRRCDLVDRVYATLPEPVRAAIADLVRDMAAGMAEAARARAANSGALADVGALLRYCRAVLGTPVLFVLRLSRIGAHGAPAICDVEREAALRAGEFIQLANVTRDLEKDLARGVAWHPALAAELRAGGVPPDERAARGDDAGRAARIAAVRAELLDLALERAPAYAELAQALDPEGGPSRAGLRASAALMLLFTDRYWLSCAARVGRPAWGRRRSGTALLLSALATLPSRRRARRLVQDVTARLSAAARGGASAPRA